MDHPAGQDQALNAQYLHVSVKLRLAAWNRPKSRVKGDWWLTKFMSLFFRISIYRTTGPVEAGQNQYVWPELVPRFACPLGELLTAQPKFPQVPYQPPLNLHSQPMKRYDRISAHAQEAFLTSLYPPPVLNQPETLLLKLWPLNIQLVSWRGRMDLSPSSVSFLSHLAITLSLYKNQVLQCLAFSSTWANGPSSVR